MAPREEPQLVYGRPAARIILWFDSVRRVHT